jgi:uncharacterized protein YndB with AHSA1/START domain
MPTSGITIKRVLRARRERVFEAWTDPALMARWLFPDAAWTATVTADVRVGGSYELAMRDPDGGAHRQFGVYREIVPVSRLVFTWSCPELAVVDSVVTVELEDSGTETGLTLTHELPPDPKVRRGHEEGWEGCLGNLDRMLRGEAQEGRKS